MSIVDGRPSAESGDGAPPFTTRLRRGWGSTAGVMFALVFLVGLVPKLLDPGCRGTVPRLLYLAMAGPLLTLALSRHYDWTSRRRIGARWALAASVALATAMGAAIALGAWSLATELGVDPPPRDEHDVFTASRVVSFGAVAGLLQFILWALTVVYPFAVEDARVRELEAGTHKLEAERLRLEAEKLRASAELASLRSRLEPHFLLNTLNAIAGLVTQQPREARRLIGCVGDLLRDSLKDADEMQPLDQELTWLQRYAEILESRHSGVLLFRWEIDDEARSSLVPRLLLQPLVENAVNHGALRRANGGLVTVRVRIEESDACGTEVVCEVEDNGPGLPDAGPRSGAFGLRSVRRRLALKYEAASLRLESSRGGTRSIVRLPVRPRGERARALEASAE